MPLKKGDVKSSSKKSLKKGGVKSSSKKPLIKERAKSAPAKMIKMISLTPVAKKPVTTKSALSVIQDKLKPPEKSKGVVALAHRLQNAPQSALSAIYRHRTLPEKPLKKEGAKSAPAKLENPQSAKTVKETSEKLQSLIRRLHDPQYKKKLVSS
jgi:hypothetical protein